MVTVFDIWTGYRSLYIRYPDEFLSGYRASGYRASGYWHLTVQYLDAKSTDFIHVLKSVHKLKVA
jgi:hypothetical protein